MISSQLAHTLRRTSLAQHKTGFTAGAMQNRGQITARRSYAEAHFHERKKGHIPWLFLSVALTVPAVYYLSTSGPKATTHGAGSRRTGPEEGAKVSGEKQSDRDPAHAVKPTGDIGGRSGAQTSKQQGVSNDDTMHPELYASGKSEKLEGVTETAKLKGTVSVDRGKGKS